MWKSLDISRVMLKAKKRCRKRGYFHNISKFHFFNFYDGRMNPERQSKEYQPVGLQEIEATAILLLSGNPGELVWQNEHWIGRQKTYFWVLDFPTCSSSHGLLLTSPGLSFTKWTRSLNYMISSFAKFRKCICSSFYFLFFPEKNITFFIFIYFFSIT